MRTISLRQLVGVRVVFAAIDAWRGAGGGQKVQISQFRGVGAAVSP